MSARTVRITAIQVDDVRVPTSDDLLGSDPFHRKPDYSVAVVRLCSDGDQTGWSVVFAIGAGTDWLVHGLRDLGALLAGLDMGNFAADPGKVQRRLLDHHQLRWLGDGVFRMVVGGLVNALWDLWAKLEGKPLWALLADLPASTLLAAIDWRYLRDALSPEEARAILERGRDGADARRVALSRKGPLAYSTAGWLGLSDAEVRAAVEGLQKRGFRHFKAKVGLDLEDDRRRLAWLRQIIGADGFLMIDANQIWGVEEAIEWMGALAEFRPHWIEEPTARDDVLGLMRIREAMAAHGIGVAAGEQVPSPVIFKQMLAGGALSHCQIDATRLAGVNDVLAVILMAAKFGVPVCPHGGGIGLCNMIRHYAIFDQIAVAATGEGRLVEYIDFLQEGVFTHPVTVSDGHYVTPATPGFGLEMTEGFLASHRFPDGAVWRDRPGPLGAAFEA
jgi:L-fuconate dehydratase